MTEKNKFVVIIQVDSKGSRYKIQGNLNVGLVKMMIGELELIKLRLLADLEASLDNKKPTHRFEFNLK